MTTIPCLPMKHTSQYNSQLLLHYDFGYLIICRFAVRENEPVGTTVGVVFAEDIDTGTFGEIVYSISGFGSEKCVVEIMCSIKHSQQQGIVCYLEVV